jgi:competence protein ComEC
MRVAKLRVAKLLMIGMGVLVAASAGAQTAQKPGELRVYFADVEGGQSTLFVAPSGESMLVDAGWVGFNNRDADRIVALARKAGISKIDNLVITHYHNDHVSGVPQLVAKIPIGRFIDHGINREDDPDTVKGWNAYQKVLAEHHAEHLVVKPGEILPVKGFHVEVVSADGNLISAPVQGPGAGEQNSACAKSPLKAIENTENDRSVGMVITFGALRILDLGDLTWAKERGLVCPVNKLGRFDVYIVSHHGLDRSSSPALVDAIAPRVAIMDNGGHKGAAPTTYNTLTSSPRLEALWQLHTAEENDAQHNTAEARIANLAGQPDAGNWLELTGHQDGSFAVENGRTGKTVDYPAQGTRAAR